MSLPERRREPLLVQVVLGRHWYEPISRAEAKRRLAGRHLDKATIRRVERGLPSVVHHYLSFAGGALREYAQFDDQPAKLLLMLKIVEYGKRKVTVAVPVYGDRRPDGRMKRISGIDLHEYEVAGKRLIENGVARPAFKLSQDPKGVLVGASFLSPQPVRAAHPACTPFFDCGRFVHSSPG